MSTSYCDRYDFFRAYGRYPEDLVAPEETEEAEVTAKVVKPKRPSVPKTTVADTKQS